MMGAYLMSRIQGLRRNNQTNECLLWFKIFKRTSDAEGYILKVIVFPVCF
jgi:hypothetical protein